MVDAHTHFWVSSKAWKNPHTWHLVFSYVTKAYFSEVYQKFRNVCFQYLSCYKL